MTGRLGSNFDSLQREKKEESIGRTIERVWSISLSPQKTRELLTRSRWYILERIQARTILSEQLRRNLFLVLKGYSRGRCEQLMQEIKLEVENLTAS